MSIFANLLRALGLTEHEAIFEENALRMDAKAWLSRRLKTLGYIKLSEVPKPPPCPRICCKDVND